MLTLSYQQTYLLRVLRCVESTTQHRLPRTTKLSLDSVIERIARSTDVQSSLETLYAVQGFDSFALRLMWCLERNGIGSDHVTVLDADIAEISEALINSPHTSSNGAPLPVAPAQEHFYDQLHAVGKVIEEVRRRLHQSDGMKVVDAEILYRVSSELEALRVSAQNAGKHEIAECVTSLLGFIQFAIENGIEHDQRVVHVIVHANLNLQTVEDSVTSHAYTSILEMTAMLKNPGTILNQ